jgi:hypothetical protein
MFSIAFSSLFGQDAGTPSPGSRQVPPQWGMSQKSQKRKYRDKTSEAAFETSRRGLPSTPVPLALSVSQLKF